MESVRSSTGLRFGRALDHSERRAIEHALAADGAMLTSWLSLPAIARTFAVVESPAALRAAQPFEPAVDVPPLCVLDIRPSDAGRTPRLMDAFGGPGRPAGVREALPTDSGIVVVWDDEVSPLSLLVDIAGIETGGRRRIAALLPLSDRSLARLAGDLLGAPGLDESRLIETHLAAYELKQA